MYFLSIQNLTCCKTFKSKSDALYFFHFKIWHGVKFSIQNLLSTSSFQILAELLSKCYQHQRTTCWIMSVWHAFVSRLVSSFWFCVLYGPWVLDGCDDYIICTTNCFIQISLEFRKWLVYRDFILKDTKILV